MLKLSKLQQQLFIECTSKKYFDRLEPYHYVPETIKPYKSIYGVFPKLQFHNDHPHPVAVVVYAPPFANLQARNKVLKDRRPEFTSKRANLAWVNSNIIMAKRLIVDPRYRRLGIAKWLLQETVKIQPYQYIEALSPIDYTNKILIGAGFECHHMPAPNYYTRVKNVLALAGISKDLQQHPKLVVKRIALLKPDIRSKLDYELKRFFQHFRISNQKNYTTDHIEYLLRKLQFPNCYFIKYNKEHNFSS
ncbi:hypothetical protein LCGC14_1951320 [marine sediment metagenome]|uniref:N-acetyltransferase domain-containing protein n=1 Tax=marine sediment metagenome TaxID=412755 RepID=A0A0F9G5T4_9ZZZZ